MNRNIKLLIAYDGTDFNGWQRQDIIPNDTVSGSRSNSIRTVQGEIEQALEKIHGQKINLTGSGRTDTGVHAAGQIANFYTSIKSIAPDRFVQALNSLLPHDVRILEACETSPGFHARFSAVSRAYRYFFICNRTALPTENRYNLQLWRYPDIETLNAYGRILLGETNCAFFTAAGGSALAENKSTDRYIYSSQFFIEGGRLVFEIRANAFLRKMVRSIAGTFLHYEEKKTPPGELRKIISSGSRSLAGPTLPPQGLFLWQVEY